MPNPFPGMDPYLEGPLWSSVHGSLVEEIARQLNPMLQPTYLALPNSRVVLTRPDPIELLPAQGRLPDFSRQECQGHHQRCLHQSGIQ